MNADGVALFVIQRFSGHTTTRMPCNRKRQIKWFTSEIDTTPPVLAPASLAKGLAAQGQSAEAVVRLIDLQPGREKEKMMRALSDEDKEWLAIRKREALEIDPATAEVEWFMRPELDPYDLYPELHEENYLVNRVYFARRPGSDIWVWLGDLPDDVQETLWERLGWKRSHCDEFFPRDDVPP